MKILWVSNGPNVATGYGNQTALFCKLLKQAGHEVAIFAFWGQEGSATENPDGLVILPRLHDPWGNDTVEAYAKWWNADIVITLLNPMVVNPEAYEKLNWLAWTPVEGEPVQSGDMRTLPAAKRIWAMSKHGEMQFRASGFENIDYVPHGVDTDVYKPINREDARETLGKLWNDTGRWKGEIGDKFLVVYNAANKGIPSRKGFYECMAAFAQFKRRYGPNALLYLHTERDGRMGEPMLDTMKLTELTEKEVIFAPQHAYMAGMLSAAYLNKVYNAADVYFHPSHGEGFGIPIVEAQAAGCPVVVNNFGTMRELVFEGHSAEPRALYMHQPGMLLSIPDVDGLADALMQSAQDALHGREYQTEFARAGAEAYDYRRVARDFMLPAIERFALSQPSPLTPLSHGDKPQRGEGNHTEEAVNA